MSTRETILIIDDQEQNLFILQEVLQVHLPEVEVITANDPHTGLDMVSPDLRLIIVDMQMPGMSGIELCRRIKATEHVEHIPVLLITAHSSSPELRAVALESGAMDFISRPIDTRELVAKIRVARTISRKETGLRSQRDDLDRKVRHTGKKLEQAEYRYKALFDSATDAIFIISFSGRILEANVEAHRLLGFRRQELKGLDMATLLAGDADALSYDSMPAAGVVDRTLAFRSRDGEHIPMEVRCRFVDLGDEQAILAIGRDITERLRAEAALAESEERHRAILEALPILIAIHSQGIVRYINDSGCAILGAKSPEGILGHHVKEFVHPDHLAKLEHRKELFETGRRSRPTDFRILRLDGSSGYIESFSMPFPYKGEDCVLVISVDVTERRKTAARLAEARDVAESANRTKSEFLANMSHEIRTPLNGIMGMLQLLRMSGLKSEQNEYIEAALQSSKRLTGLLSDILDLSRVEAGRLEVRPEPFQLRELVSSVGQLFRPAAEQKGLELALEVDPGVPDWLVGDGSRLQQVVNNLVGNALKFTEQGRVGVQASMLPVHACGGHRILIRVSDTGIGIAEDLVDSLFDPFAQAEKSYQRQYQGAGLGLSICKHLVGLMNGTIAVQSEEGRGTSFYLSIPFGLLETEDVLPGDVERSGPSRQLTVLLAEDDTTNQLAMARQLELEGCHVLRANDGRQALEMLRANAVDIVLMDVQMPVLDGVQATREIRQGKAGESKAKVPIIAMTAYAMEGDREVFLNAGMDHYLAKPIEYQDLKEALSTIMAKA